MHPNVEGILESSLYVTDVARSAQFYEKIFGLQVISDFGERGCAMKAGNRQVLLLFKKGGSRAVPTPHDGDGELHLSHSRFQPQSWQTGKRGWRKTESPWKRSARGNWAVTASIFGI
jgi:catechol 2,3-dioxygenase-like lactoylglutathione lyase family enzyme